MSEHLHQLHWDETPFLEWWWQDPCDCTLVNDAVSRVPGVVDVLVEMIHLHNTGRQMWNKTQVWGWHYSQCKQGCQGSTQTMTCYIKLERHWVLCDWKQEQPKNINQYTNHKRTLNPEYSCNTGNTCSCSISLYSDRASPLGPVTPRSECVNMYL